MNSSFLPVTQLHKYPSNKSPIHLKQFFILPILSSQSFSHFRALPSSSLMALKAVHVSDVPNLDQVPDNASFYSPRIAKGMEFGTNVSFKAGNNFMVIGHRGNGMNMLQSTDPRMKAIKENTIRSFNAAGNYPVDFIEFDVQVTKDACPIIFHDNFIFSNEQDNNGTIFEKRVTDLTLSEFLSYGPQREAGVVGKTLLRKTKEGKILNWAVESDDYFCTLQEAFQNVKPCLGFNIELKFDDHVVYQQEYLIHVLQSILQVVFDHAKERPIIFSSFQPDAILLIKKLQSTYPVFFLTNGGNEIYQDVRRNSLEEAIKVCAEGGLDGIVSEVRGIFRNPGAVNKIKKEMKKSLLTYGKLNNVVEAVYMQHLMGVDGVIVDLVGEITEAVGKMVKKPSSYTEDDDDCEDGDILFEGGDGQIQVQRRGNNSKPQFSQRELAFLLKLIPELIQQQ